MKHKRGAGLRHVGLPQPYKKPVEDWGGHVVDVGFTWVAGSGVRCVGTLIVGAASILLSIVSISPGSKLWGFRALRNPKKGLRSLRNIPDGRLCVW